MSEVQMVDEVIVEDDIVTLEQEEIVAPETQEVTAASPDDEAEAPIVDEKQKAINKLAFEKREQKRRADDLQRQLDELSKKQAVAVEVPKYPTEEDFDYDAVKYQTALADYQSKLVQSHVQKSLSNHREQEAKLREELTQREMQQRFNKKVEESKIPGYAEAVQTLPVFDPSVTSAIMQSDDGPKIAYYLSQHLDLADSIASSSPIVAAMKIGEISARISGANKTLKTSKTPDPLEPIKQGGAKIGKAESELIAGATFE